MPLRESVQLPLISPRWRAARQIGIRAATVGLLLFGAVQLQNVLHTLGEDGFVQALRQNVWKRALADQARATPWPWQELSTNMSLAPGVPRLGLSAALRSHAVLEPPMPVREIDSRTKTAAAAKPHTDAPQGDVVLSDVAIGDSITFTAADGATCVYRVTGRRVVDPHLAASEAKRFGAESLFECGPLESLIRRATQGAAQRGSRAPIAPGADQQKL